MAIQICRDQCVLVRAPLRCKDKDIEEFFGKHQDWVDRKLQESRQYPGLAESQYVNEGSLWVMGESLVISVDDGSPVKVTQLSNCLKVVQGDKADITKTSRLVTQWKRNYASNIFQEKLAYWFSMFPVPIRKYQFRLRKMKRQWGNCNHQGVITINSQLIRYPESCIDYVIVHELTHLKHLHHGWAFYDLLEKVMPDWQQQKLLLSRFSGLNHSVE